MSRLAADSRGNVLAISAAALVPLLAMVGGAIDVSRVYMARTRLQQACDAGALAGRKAMGNIKTLTVDEQNKAKEFFDFNFPDGTWSSANRQRAFVKGAKDGVVAGSASIDMPTSVMRMFGYTKVPLSVTCESTLNIPNTDVMFVLDVTGSMNDVPAGDNVNKITGLRDAVKTFYGLLGAGAKTGPGRIRYGFMPYSSNVNVGNILLKLNSSYILGGTTGDTWHYQSRVGKAVYKRINYQDRNGNQWSSWEQAVEWTYQDNPSVSLNGIKNGEIVNPAYWPGPTAGDEQNDNYWNSKKSSKPTTQTLKWAGCIEEAQTVNTIGSSTALNLYPLPPDLQIDLIPDTRADKWKPFLPELQYERDGDWVGRPNGNNNACPRPASELQQYTSDIPASGGKAAASTAFNAYVDTLTPGGNTYHDIGLMWGARFLSPDGIFKSTNADSASPGGYQVGRHLVFMTDGALVTPYDNSDPWGYNPLDNRVIPAGKTDTTPSHRRRVQIICNAMKGKGFTIWVIGFGIDTMPAELQSCASDSSHWSLAKNSAQLKATFSKIAQAVSGLRLSS